MLVVLMSCEEYYMTTTASVGLLTGVHGPSGTGDCGGARQSHVAAATPRPTL